MKLKFKLPSRSTTAGVVPKRNLGAVVRKLRRYALYGAGLFFVFFVFAWINLPTKAIRWLSSIRKTAGAWPAAGTEWAIAMHKQRVRQRDRCRAKAEPCFKRVKGDWRGVEARRPF